MRCGRVLFTQLGVLASIFVTGLAESSFSSVEGDSFDEEKQDLRYLGGEHATPSPTTHPNPQPTNAPNTDVDVTGCFSSMATVTVLGKKMGSGATTTTTTMSMSALEVGDVILADNHGHYSMVYAFGHYAPDKRSEFLQIYTTTMATTTTPAPTTGVVPLEMTKEHLVFLQDQIHPVRADALRVGNVLRDGRLTTSSSGGTTSGVGATITKIDRIWRSGLYAPLTQVGMLVVDGIVASSYVSFQAEAEDEDEDEETDANTKAGTGVSRLGLSQHDYVHMGLSPFRLVCSSTMMRMIISPSFCSATTTTTTTSNTNNIIHPPNADTDGMPSYVAFAVTLNQWAQAQHWFVELGVLLLVVVLTGSCWMFERLIWEAATYFSGIARLAILMIMIIAGMWFAGLQKENYYHIRIQRATTTSTVHPKKKQVKCA
jgi:hypothetical protein